MCVCVCVCVCVCEAEMGVMRDDTLHYDVDRTLNLPSD